MRAEKKRKPATVTTGSDAALGRIVREDSSEEVALDRDQRESAMVAWEDGGRQGRCRVIGNIPGHMSGI